MARVIDADVKEILDTDVDTTPFITAAHVLIEKLLSAADLSEEQKTEIERWLAAHFACMRDPRENRVTTDRSEAYFEGKTDMGLNFTRYGQMVLLLDTSGLLSQHNTATEAGRRQATVVVAPRLEE